MAGDESLSIFFGFILTFLLVNGACSACSGSSCGECISSDPSCSWCAQKNFTSPRCQTYSSLSSAGCEDIQNPISTTSKIADQLVGNGDGINRAIQVQPQHIKITTRPRKKETFTMKFRAADNFPVDLYFLFDTSRSMIAHIQSLASLAKDIGSSIGDISSNYKMGYGVFQDKVILPFTDTTPQRLANPCINSADASKGTCSPPFEVRHLLSMTRDVNRFEAAVNNTGLTGNIDRPEGSIDAILQAVTCANIIGWRARSRKLLIFASNDRFHIAGDGKLAGIVVPNDGMCHLDNAGNYAKELLQDYPSVSQLTHIVSKHEVHIIFAVSESQKQLFSELSQRIPQSTVELLADVGTDNKDIREIIEKKYKEIISEVEILHTQVEGVDIKIKAKSDTCERKGTNICKGIEIGKEVDFEVDVKVTSCSTTGSSVRRVEIYPGSLSQDRLILDIDTQCECGCTADSSTWEVDSPECSGGNGTLKCGQCDCHGDRFGQLCECDPTDTESQQSGCKKPGDSSEGPQCNGAGRCVCGKCFCDEGFSGDYCQCNDRSCGSFQREICGGIRGRCECGQCVCEPEFTGPTCGCPISNSTCMAADGKLCSAHGSCACGECHCDEGYVGLYCQNCVLCGVCDNPDFRDCAQCLLDHGQGKVGPVEATSKLMGECQSMCPAIDPVLVDQLEGDNGPGDCSVKLADGCFLAFRINSTRTNVTILVQSTKVCPTPLNMTPIVVGVVVGVVILGLAILLLWKLVTWFVDRREYSKFQEDLAKMRWAQNDNPFYKGATTTYRNPMMDPNDPSLDKH